MLLNNVFFSKKVLKLFLYSIFRFIWNYYELSFYPRVSHARECYTNHLTQKSKSNLIYVWLETRAIYILCNQRDSSSRILLIWRGKKNGSGCQAAGIEASVSLRLLTNVVLNVEFRLVRVLAFSGLQLPETKVDQLVSINLFANHTYIRLFFTKSKLSEKNTLKLD